MEYTLGTGYFLKILLGKNYSLSGKVIDALVKYFARFKDDARELPVLWHQTLLLFITKYYCMLFFFPPLNVIIKKNDQIVFLNEEQKAQLRGLVEKKSHPLITPEILKALNPGAAAGAATGAMTDI